VIIGASSFGVYHHDDVASKLQRLVVAALLVPAVAPVPLVLHDVPDAQASGLFHRVVGALVIDQHHFVHQVEGDLLVGLFQRQCRPVGRQHHDHFFALVHGACAEFTGHPQGKYAPDRGFVT
jgi:hypothetical protein